MTDNTGGQVKVENDYDLQNAMLASVGCFGALQKSCTYNADGPLNTVVDGLIQVTSRTTVSGRHGGPFRSCSPSAIALEEFEVVQAISARRKALEMIADVADEKGIGPLDSQIVPAIHGGLPVDEHHLRLLRLHG